MELKDYVAIVRKRWVSIVLVTVLVTGAAVAMTLLATPLYSARSQVFVSVRTGDTSTDLVQGASFTQRQVKSYTDLVTSPRVLIPVIEQLDLATTPDELATSISASSPIDTVLINITATNPDPQVASDIANAVAESLSTQVRELEEPEDGESPVEISSVRAATPPPSPSSPKPVRNTALGFLLGLAIGFGLAVLREVLDTRVRTADDIRQVTDSSVMAAMAHDDEASDHPLIVHSAPHSIRAEAFRRLRTNLQFLDVADRLESIVVTSSLPGEGKSTTAINLAITLADAGSRVALVDADLRRPSVAEYMGIEGRAGLTTVLIGKAGLDDVIQPWGDGKLHVLTSGQVPPNPSEMIGSHAMAWLLGELVKRYDVVVIDTPPLLPVTDAAILARLTGGALVVAAANRVHRTDLADAIGSLEAVGARVLGVVMNRLARKQTDSYSYYGQESDRAGQRRSKQARRRSGGNRGDRGNSGTLHAGRRRPVARATARPIAASERGGAFPTESNSLSGILSNEQPPPPTMPSRWPGDPIG